MNQDFLHLFILISGPAQLFYENHKEAFVNLLLKNEFQLAV